VRRERSGLGAGGAVGEQDAGPAVVLVRAGEPDQVVGVERLGGALGGLGGVVGGGDAEELDGHGVVLLAVTGTGGGGGGDGANGSRRRRPRWSGPSCPTPGRGAGTTGGSRRGRARRW